MLEFGDDDNLTAQDDGSKITPDAVSDTPDAPQEGVFQNLYELDESEKESILKEQNDRYRASCKYMDALLPSMLKAYKKYRSIAEPLKDDLGREIDGRANIYVPYPWAIIESAMPRLAGRLPRVHAFPRKRIEQTKIDNIQDLIVYSLDRMQFLRLQQLWIRQFEIYGWSPLVYSWRHEVRECFDRTRDPATGQLTMQKSEKVVWDDFTARVIDVFDSFIQPGVETIEDGDWFIFREWMSKKDIVARVKGGIFYSEVLAYIEDNPASSGMSMMANDSRQDRDSYTGLIKDFEKHSFGRYEVRYTLENDKIIVTINGKVLARVGDNPNPMQEKSIINLNLLPLVNEPIGVSTIEALGGLPEKLNALTNARLDNIALILNKVIVADKFSQTDFDNIVMSPGNVILTDNIETSMKFLEMPDLNQSSQQEVSTTKEELQFVSGISDYLVGTKSSARLADTATGVSSVIREANARFALKLSTFEAYPLRKLIEAIHLYNMMYMPEEKRIHVLGPNGYQILDVKLDDVLVECDFAVEPGSSAPLDQVSRRDGLTGLLDRVIQLPQVVDINKYMREVFEAYELHNPEELLIQASKELPEAEDAKLAQAENIALTQGQEIDLKGNDRLHITIHSRGLAEAETPEAKEYITAHLQQHLMREQQAMMSIQSQHGNIFGGTEQSTQGGVASMFGNSEGGSNVQPNSPPNQQPPQTPPSGANPVSQGPSGLVGNSGASR